MSRYPRNFNGGRGGSSSATRGGAKPRSGSAAAALPRPRPSTGGRIPAPPKGAIPAAGLLLAGGYIYNWLAGEEEPPDKPAVGPGQMAIAGRAKLDRKNDGSHSRDYYGTVQKGQPTPWVVYNIPNPTKEWEIYESRDTHPKNDYIDAFYPTRVVPPGGPVPPGPYAAPRPFPQVLPGTENDRPVPPMVPPHPQVRPTSRPVAGSNGIPIPANVPDVRPGTLISIGVTPTTVAPVHPMAPVNEVKTHSRAIHGMVTAFFSVGGELIDFTRCFVFAVGFTYTNRNGEEKPIPRDQWGEYLIREARIRSGGDVPPGVADRHRRYTDRYSPQEKAQRLILCLIKNGIEDALIGASSRAKRDFAEEIGLNAGLLGIDSQIALAHGDLPWAGLI